MTNHSQKNEMFKASNFGTNKVSFFISPIQFDKHIYISSDAAMNLD